MKKPWTEEDLWILKKWFPHRKSERVALLLKRNISSVRKKAYELGLKKSNLFYSSSESGRMISGDSRGKETRYKKGQKSWNAGKKIGTTGRSHFTFFKKGSLPHNTLQDGEITIRNCQGKKYYFIRESLSKWIHLHVYLWKEKFGKIPSGYCVVFKDKNPMNCVLDNLELITRKENMLRNTIHRYPEEIKTTINAISKLKRTINEREKKDNR